MGEGGKEFGKSAEASGEGDKDSVWAWGVGSERGKGGFVFFQIIIITIEQV